MTFFLLILFFMFSITFCGEIKNKIYYEFPEQSVSYCIRRLNRSSSIGCSSKANGNSGIIEVAFNESHLFAKLPQLKENTILVISSILFIQNNVTKKLMNYKYIQGVIVIENTLCNDSICNDAERTFFSEDYEVPNSEYSLYINHTFNKGGSKLGFINWPFPIAFISKMYQDEQKKIISCYNQFNKSPSSSRRCSLEIRNFMAAVKSAETCIKYQNIQNRFSSLFSPFQFCTDMTGMNYAVRAKDVVKSRDLNSVIVLMSRLDSLSMFERSAASANGAITSTALLLAVMKLLMSQPEFQTGATLGKDVLFLFLDNESYDYLGTHRFLYDLYQGNIAKTSSTPMNISHLDLLLEFGELAYSNFSEFNLFYPYSYLKGNDRNQTKLYLNQLKEQFLNFGFTTVNDNQQFDLPPSSVQFLLRERMMPAIVMTDYRSSFNNPYYNSFMDKIREKNRTKQLIAIVNSVASFIFKTATGKKLNATVSESDKYSPNNIIDCFTDNLLCDLLLEVLPLATLHKLQRLGTPIPTQAHTSNKHIPLDYRFSSILRNLIVYLSGQRVNNSVCNACSSCVANLSWITFGNDSKQCFLTRIDAYEEFSFDSPKVPLWLTSTIVDGQSLRMFVRARNPSLLVAGLLLTISSLVLMSLVSPKLSVIFSKVA